MELLRDRLEPDPKMVEALARFDPSLTVEWHPQEVCLAVFQKAGARRVGRVDRRVVYEIRGPAGMARQIEMYDLDEMRRQREDAPGRSWASSKRRNKEAEEQSLRFVRDRFRAEMKESVTRRLSVYASEHDPGFPHRFHDLGALPARLRAEEEPKVGHKRIIIPGR